VTSEPGNLPRTVCDLPAENRKRANRLSTLSPLRFKKLPYIQPATNINSGGLTYEQYRYETR
jgi:hypothetical protein